MSLQMWGFEVKLGTIFILAPVNHRWVRFHHIPWKKVTRLGLFCGYHEIKSGHFPLDFLDDGLLNLALLAKRLIFFSTKTSFRINSQLIKKSRAKCLPEALLTTQFSAWKQNRGTRNQRDQIRDLCWFLKRVFRSLRDFGSPRDLRFPRDYRISLSSQIFRLLARICPAFIYKVKFVGFVIVQPGILTWMRILLKINFTFLNGRFSSRFCFTS